MIKYQVDYGLKILFIGVNPHPGSYARGVPFSNNKLFWYLLSDAGLIAQSREYLKDDKRLKQFYSHDFIERYHFGSLNVVNRPSRTATELKRREAIPGQKRIIAAIQKYEPQIVCFVGKITYQLFSGLREVHYGWQPMIAASKIFVMHAPHHGPAKIRIEELHAMMRAL